MQQNNGRDTASVLSFFQKGGDILPERIWRLPCADADPCETFRIQTDRGYGDSRLSSTQKTENGDICLTHRFGDGLRLDTLWEYREGALRRRDILTAERGKVSVYQFQTRLYLAGYFCLYAQRNHWCSENQGAWEPLKFGIRTLHAPGGRSGNGSSPYLCLYRESARSGIAVHLVARMDWQLSAEAVYIGSENPYTVLSTGPDDLGYAYQLNEGESVCLSELILTSLPEPHPEAAVHVLQQYLLSSPCYQRERTIPIEYNSWFLNWDNFDAKLLEEQLETAAALGCEAFVVDAGWYGQMNGNWIDQVGDWREKQSGAFCGDMRAFADLVREKGLIFGLWVEPERYDRSVPVVQAHPDWFIDEGTEKLYPDFQKPEMRTHVLDTMCGLIDRYGLGWIKIDYNNVLGRDPYGMAHAGYLDAWYGIVDELHKRYPSLIIENCASGGMRLDLESLKHYDVFFPTDSVNVVDTIRICAGYALRALPGRLLRWMAVGQRGVGAINGSIDSAEVIPLDFAVRACMCGQIAFTGDLCVLSADDREKVKRYIVFAKQWRVFLYQSVGIPLMPVQGIDDRKSFAAMLMADDSFSRMLLFSYRLDGAESACRVFPEGLDPDAVYSIECYDNGVLGTYFGRQLLADGLEIAFPVRFTAKIYIIVKIS